MSRSRAVLVFAATVVGMTAVVALVVFAVTRAVFRPDGAVSGAMDGAQTQLRSPETSAQLLVDDLDQIPGASAQVVSAGEARFDVSVDGDAGWSSTFARVADACQRGGRFYTHIALRPTVPSCTTHTGAVSVQLGNSAFDTDASTRLAAQLVVLDGVTHVDVGSGVDPRSVVVDLDASSDPSAFVAQYQELVQESLGHDVSLQADGPDSAASIST